MQHIEATSLASTSSSLSSSTQSLVQLPQGSRFGAMDMQRSIIMMLMAFAHCREYIGGPRYSNINWNHPPLWNGISWLDMIQQIIVSTVAAGGFFMMMGAGIIFLFHARLKNGWTEKSTCFYLIKRGLLLILIQLTLLQAFEILAEETLYFYVGVLISLGVNMILASLLYYLILSIKSLRIIRHLHIEYTLPVLLIILITSFIQLKISHILQSAAIPDAWMNMLVLGGKFEKSILIDINFTPIPWFPAVAFGMIVGQLFLKRKQQSITILFRIALSFLLIWFLARTALLSGLINAGDYKILGDGEQATLASYFCVSKYPPSIDYFLWSLGLNLLGIVLWSRAEKIAPRLLFRIQSVKLFGQCALFFFIMHWFVYYGISRFLVSPITNPLGIIALWLTGLMILYPLCKRYHVFKSGKDKASFWRMF